MNNVEALSRQIRLWLLIFILGLLASGLTAFPLQWEVNLLNSIVNGPGSPWPLLWPAAADWVAWVNEGLQVAYTQYPFLAYGTDWLAFAHIVIAIAFWGPLKDPVRNLWVIEFGMIACVLVLPLAFICGPLRSIPFFHQLLDCSFGVLGIIPLWFARSATVQLERVERSGSAFLARM